MTKLSVNVNKIATLRNTREIGIPSVTKFARVALEAGAAGITIHPRPDQRHIRHDDVPQIAGIVGEFPGRELNIEGNPFFEFEKFVADVRPDQCTLVPDAVGASTSDHGWDLKRDADRLVPVVKKLQSLGGRVSLFMDPDPAAMELAAKLGVERVELYTAPYAHGFSNGAASQAVAPYTQAAQRAKSLGLDINAGHDLSLENLGFFLKNVPHIAEVSIGHALIADTLEFGLAQTVRKYLAICESA